MKNDYSSYLISVSVTIVSSLLVVVQVPVFAQEKIVTNLSGRIEKVETAPESAPLDNNESPNIPLVDQSQTSPPDDRVIEYSMRDASGQDVSGTWRGQLNARSECAQFYFVNARN